MEKAAMEEEKNKAGVSEGEQILTKVSTKEEKDGGVGSTGGGK